MLMLFIAASSQVFGAEHDIIISKDDYHTGSRTIPGNSVTATYDDVAASITFEFSETTASKLIVYSADETPVIQQSSPIGLFAQVDVSSLTAGEYAVEIYAFGEWWIGYFEID